MLLLVNGTLCKCRISLYFVFADKKLHPRFVATERCWWQKPGMEQNELYIRMVNKVRVS